ncbi:MAG: TIGR01440 family protein [Clostridiaceae bacterium]|nr:TIGR01440 family protein [Eubacteriales bacterium]
MSEIHAQMKQAVEELFAAADNLREGDIVVVGCSTSEIGGRRIGTASSEAIAHEVMEALYPAVKNRGLFLAVQCCEHLNRSLVVERACLERYDLQQVWVRPQLHAGGAMAMRAVELFDAPVMAEDLRSFARAGLDIGGTLIGMHLRRVAVPIHASVLKIGEANLVMARTRPKYVGGPRAAYDEIAPH